MSGSSHSVSGKRHDPLSATKRQSEGGQSDIVMNEKSMSFTLFVVHLPEDVSSDKKLLELFVSYGATKCNLMRHESGRSRGFGFVDFKTKKEAQAAIKGMNGHQIGRKKLRVTFARKQKQKKNKNSREQDTN